MPYLEIDRRRVYYEIHGSGQPLMLLHHGFGCSKMWKEIYPPLVQAGWQVILYDRRGYGSSERGEGFYEFYNSDGFREDMAAEMARVFELLEIGPAHLVGQCEGGVTSVDFAASHPELVRSLALGSVQTWSLMDMVRFNAEKFPRGWDELRPELRAKFIEWHGEEFAESLYEMARTKGGAYGAGYFDLRPRLREVRCPALVIYPDRSALFAPDQGVAMYQALEQGELAFMPYCGHNTYEYRPAEYLRLLLDFYQRLAERTDASGRAKPSLGPDPSITCAG